MSVRWWGELCPKMGRTISIGAAALGLGIGGCNVEEEMTHPVALDDLTGEHEGNLEDLITPDLMSVGVAQASTAGSGKVRFLAGPDCYSGEFTFRLPSRFDPESLPGVALQVGYRGPSGAVKAWSWEVLDLEADRYVTLTDSSDAEAGRWTYYEAPLPGAPARYVSGNNRIYVRYGCSGQGDPSVDSELDFMALVVTDGNEPPPPPPPEEPPPEEPPPEEPPPEEPPAEEPPGTDPNIEARIDAMRSYFDDELDAKRAEWDALSRSGANDSVDYYLLMLPLDGVLSMYEATLDREYLELALDWIENMIDTAFVTNGTSSSWPEGEGWLRTNGQSSLLDEMQAVQPMGRVARMVLTDSSLIPAYGARATAIRDWVDEHILTKWMVRRAYGNYSSGWSWMLNTHLESPGSLSGYIQGHQLHAMRVAQNIYDAGVTGARRNGETWADLAEQIAQAFASRLELQSNGSYLWDVDRYLWSASTTGIVDTSHSNKHPAAMMDLYEAGVVFDAIDMDRMARTLTRNIWNGRSDWPDPDALPAGSGSIWFANYIDGQDALYSNQVYTGGGSSHPHYQLPNGMSGMVYDGWCRLGAVDEDAQDACEALLGFLQSTHDTANAIRNRNGGGGLGSVALAGHLARNLRYRDW